MEKGKIDNKVLLKDIEQEIQTFILKQNPRLTINSEITYPQLLNYRLSYVRGLLVNDSVKIDELNQLISKEVKEKELVSNNLNRKFQSNLTVGQKTADGIAKFGGSWPFIFIFIAVLILWIVLNSVPLLFPAFDKYPFILLNLALSCLAAIQAPIIMMSQNRQESRDRQQAENDYRVNLKAEIEVNLLHEKMDYLINSQWQHLIEIQHIQLELLGEIQEQLNTFEEKNKKK